MALSTSTPLVRSRDTKNSSVRKYNAAVISSAKSAPLCSLAREELSLAQYPSQYRCR
jgi:hypothetical protein